MIIVFMPKAIPKTSFYVDYPLVAKSKLIFIRQAEDLQKLNGIPKDSVMILYVSKPGRDTIQAAMRLKHKFRIGDFLYDKPMENSTFYSSDFMSFRNHSFNKIGFDIRQGDRDRYITL